MRLAGAVVLVSCVVACSKKSAPTAQSCGPLTVTLDGAPLAFTAGRATTDGPKNEPGFHVTVYNHDKTTCEEELADSNDIDEGEVSLSAYVAPGIRTILYFASNNYKGADLALVGPKPQNVGDLVTICATGFEATLPEGDHKGKLLRVKGLIKGHYCGHVAPSPKTQ